MPPWHLRFLPAFFRKEPLENIFGLSVGDSIVDFGHMVALRVRKHARSDSDPP